MSERWKAGLRLRFVDSNAVVDSTRDRSGKTVMATGVINGEPLSSEDGDYIPVFTSREGGREATTIYVHESNVVEVLPS